jgi:hypothetical protein
MHVTDNDKFGNKLLRAFIIGQAHEPNTCVETSPFKTESQSAAKELAPPRLLWIPRVNYCIYSIKSFVPILSQLYPTIKYILMHKIYYITPHNHILIFYTHHCFTT